jgi:hypothetical protein
MANLQIPISKAKSKITVDTDSLPEEMYQLAMIEGLKVLLNSKMAKVTVAKLEGEELAKAQAAAMEIAEKNLKALMAGEIKKSSASSSKIPAAVRAEAMRLARIAIRDTIRANNMIPSRVPAADITAAAKALIEGTNNEYIKQAQINLDKKPVIETKIDLGILGLAESPKLVAKAEKIKAERKSEVSAKQAGKVAPRKASAVQHHVAN